MAVATTSSTTMQAYLRGAWRADSKQSAIYHNARLCKPGLKQIARPARAGLFRTKVQCRSDVSSDEDEVQE